MSQKKNEGIMFPTEIRVVGSYTDRLLNIMALKSNLADGLRCEGPHRHWYPFLHLFVH